MTLRPMFTAKSPLIVPGSASRGFVAPINFLALAEKHYGVHKDRPFFSGLVDFITSGPVIAMVWEGEGVVASARKLIGATKPLEAEPGTIRGDLAVNIGRNVIHGSDGSDTAAFEIDLWFQDNELVDWTPSDQSWRVE